MKLKRYNIVSMYEPVESIREMQCGTNIYDEINNMLPNFTSP